MSAVPEASPSIRARDNLSALGLHEMAASGVCILISTHDLASVDALCDTVTLLHRRAIAHGVPSDVMTTGNLLTTFGMVA